MTSPHPIIAELRARRLKAGLTQKAVADRIHYCQQSVTHWEVGTHQPPLLAVGAYAAVLGCRLVLGDDDGPTIAVLRQHRLDAGWTQRDTADRLGYALTTLCRWETGGRRVTLPVATAYAGLFGLELELREVPDA